MVENMICKDGPTLFIPKIMFLTKGKGTHTDYLTSFELALRDAEIADLNLVSVSSIKPPQCKIVSRQEGRKYLMPGQIVFAVMTRSATNEPNMLLLLLLVWQDLQMIHVMVICRNIILPVKPLKRLEIMPKILPWKCLLLLWACLMILYLLGIREKNNGDFQEKFTKHKILHNLQKDIKMDCGLL